MRSKLYIFLKEKEQANYSSIAIDPVEFDNTGSDFKRMRIFNITDGKTIFGKMHVIEIDTSFIDHNIPGLDEFSFYDSHSQQLSDLYSHVLDGCDMYGNTIYYLERLEIKPEYRNKGIGTLAIAGFVNKFVSTSKLFFVKPFPLKWEGKVETKEDQQQFNLDLKRIKKFWSEKLQIEQYEDTDFHYLDGDNSYSYFEIINK